VWIKYITRRLAVQVTQQWNFGWGTAMEKVYGVSVRNTLVFRDQKKTEYYVDQKEHNKYVLDLYNLLDNKVFVKNFHKDAQKKIEEIFKKIINKLDMDLSNLSNEELIKLYQNFILPNTEEFYVRMWTVFNIGKPLSIVIERELKKYVKNSNKLIKYLLILSSPAEPNDVLNERIDLLKLKILESKIDQENFLQKLKLHTENYKHIPMFDFDHNPYTISHFRKEINLIKNPEKEIRKIRKAFEKRKSDLNRIFKEIKPSHKLKNLIEFLKENVFLRDYRDMVRQKLNLQLRKFYQEVGQRLDLNVKQVAVLTNEEIVEYLNKNKKFPKKEIKQRERNYLLIQKDKKYWVYSGKNALVKFRKELKEVIENKKILELHGIIASKGVAKGIVKVVYTNKDLYKINKGDILVACMTRQDFVPAMRKCSAIVIDEGSITCHAAIIARELSVPCLVAIKQATRVLKDGDLVEVDANKGAVKKIK
jgi:phosphohistidine swiveling domain-containing protein